MRGAPFGNVRERTQLACVLCSQGSGRTRPGLTASLPANAGNPVLTTGEWHAGPAPRIRRVGLDRPLSRTMTAERFGTEAGRLAGKFPEGVDRSLRVLADLDEIAVGIAHVAAQLAAMVIERLGQELRALARPMLVACANVRDAQIEEAAHVVRIMRRREPHLGLV